MLMSKSGETTPYLTISVTQDERGEPVLAVSGDLDVVSRDYFRQLIASVLDVRQPRTMTLNLAGVGFADCSSLSVLMQARQQLAARGGRLVIAGAQPAVRRIISLTGLDGWLDLREPQPDAAAARGGDSTSRYEIATRSAGLSDGSLPSVTAVTSSPTRSAIPP